jgi:hypothetical protein
LNSISIPPRHAGSSPPLSLSDYYVDFLSEFQPLFDAGLAMLGGGGLAMLGGGI